jgi:hypothetical protein
MLARYVDAQTHVCALVELRAAGLDVVIDFVTRSTELAVDCCKTLQAGGAAGPPPVTRGASDQALV